MAAQFPGPTAVAPDTNVFGPPYLKLLDVPPEYAVTEKTFKDLGRSYGLATTSTVLVWRLFYDGLTEAQFTVLLNHWNDAQGAFEGFTFRHPRTSVLHSDVHYVEFNRDHSKVWSSSCEIVLEKRPA